MNENRELPEKVLGGRIKYQAGAETVEFLITLPVILIVLAIIFDFGVAFSDQAVLTNATRAAAREVVQGASAAEAQQAVDRITPSLLSHQSSDPLPVINITQTGTNPGDTVNISISHQFTYFLLPSFLAGVTDIELTATTVMHRLPN
jgi:Flp pilus assembly protein TadG